MVSTVQAPLAATLAQWAVGLKWAEVPLAQRELAKLRILDTVGLVLTALQGSAASAVLDLAKAQGGVGESVLMGAGRRVPAASAALVHGTLAHCTDFDDTLVDSVVHPGSFVVPVALAVGEATLATPEEIMTAVAIGYEVAARVGGVFGRRLHARGFHPSAVVGPVASATVAARLYGLAPPQMVAALGLAGSMSGGLMEFLSDGSWSKWLHLGWAAHGGILAAQLAQRGFRGPATVLEGPAGLFSSFLANEAVDWKQSLLGLGVDWRSAAAEFKYYPCAHVIQPYIDAALRLKRQARLEPGQIFAVHCAIAPWCIPLVCIPREQKVHPTSPLEAIASLPFMIATALADGEVTLDSVAPAALERAQVTGLAERIQHVADASLGAQFEGRIEIVTHDGRRLMMEAPLAAHDTGAVRTKFRKNALRAFPLIEVERLAGALEAGMLDADFFDLLRAGNRRHA